MIPSSYPAQWIMRSVKLGSGYWLFFGWVRSKISDPVNNWLRLWPGFLTQLIIGLE